jgi:glutamine synthetase
MPAGPGPGLGVWGRPVYLPSLWRGDRRWGKSQYFRKWGAVDLEELTRQAESGEIDTVLLALTDMQGRLQGKRLAVDHFIDDVAAHGAEGCNYLLAVDVEMNTVDGFAMASWDRGYGDFVMKPDLATLRPVPWHPATALLLADLEWADGSPVMASPRQVLRGQIERLAERGWSANAATELEFLVFRDSYEQAWKKGYSGLDPATIYKTAAKEIADQEGMAISFMAKFDEREGSSCHIHFSLADAEGALFHRERGVFESFLAGQLRYARELTLLVAPNINSYKRFAAGSFAPTTIAWANDNRTCAFRVVGDGAALRFENRSGGADLNPYMALAATVAAGLAGVEARLELEPAYVGNAYLATDRPRLPGTLREARDLFADSQLAQTAFGPEVVAHYVNAADVELAAFETAVTDWERTRGFERL